MANILKTLPTRFARGELERFFGMHERCADPQRFRFYFTLGRGKPGQAIERLYFTHRGIIIGHFDVAEVVQNAGQLPKLTTLDGEPSQWQIKPDRWVAVCPPPWHPVECRLCRSGDAPILSSVSDKMVHSDAAGHKLCEPELVYHEPFRGWRYFDLSVHRQDLGSRVRL
jgi:hypothetical protein